MPRERTKKIFKLEEQQRVEGFMAFDSLGVKCGVTGEGLWIVT